jgi:hypothetical protein
MKELTKTELVIIYNLTRGMEHPKVKELHRKVSKELSYRGAFL